MVNYRSFLSVPSSYRCITLVKMMMIGPFLLVPPRAVASGVKGGDNSTQGAPQNPGIIVYRPMFCE